ncbi:MAG: hypothetical protein FWC71_04180 [Defluviitaleaceae bacterium]|nr:hypothetical protein [Defluviitaleaceae bacterium]
MKKLLLAGMLILGALLLAACSTREAISAEEFAVRMQGAGHLVEDVTNDYDIAGMVTYMLGRTEHFYVEFIIWDTDERARSQFQSVQRVFENNRSNTVSYRSTNTQRVDRLTQTTAGRFEAVVRIENTLLVMNADASLQSEVQAILNLLGY